MESLGMKNLLLVHKYYEMHIFINFEVGIT